MSQITLFGLGAMGQALAHRYLDKGYTTTIWNRTASKAHSSGLIAKGASQARTVTEGLEAADLVILCLLDNASVKDTLAQGIQALHGKTIVNLTNGTPSQARELSEWVGSLGAEYIHGGIMAVPDMIASGSPHSMLLYSGDGTVFERVENHLAHLGVSKYLGADPGSASLHDLALLSGMYGLFSGFLHATALARSARLQTGMSAEDFVSQLLTPWLSAMTQYLAALAKQIDSGDYATQGSNIAMQVAGMENIVSASEDAGVTAAFILPILGLMKRAVQGGFGGADVSAVVEFMGVER
ncbi:NAD(P)-dependent oxidoreductase [Aspergillus mulundensis]|uniref:Uncharacterized protein n=1 Tax=Aspergillus mulundensis TaxID=1810919 RepID=A0A3D8SJI9_9EURO|nr:hypothetical protein DSM5745_03132 [Aspergillus mulundensis]RDW86490.1 hypothetical protein DSM5745_03132 [Aspergillus mulundensis]